MHIIKVLKPTILLILILISFNTLLVCEEPSNAASVIPQDNTDMSEAKQKAVARASIVPIEMGFDLAKYISVPVDKNEPTGVLNDSTIKQFIVPVALEADWWIVIFLPENPKVGPPICVYLDKRLDVVRGYVIGPPLKARIPNSQKEKTMEK